MAPSRIPGHSVNDKKNNKTALFTGEFPDSVKINETVTFGDENMDDGIDFEEMDSSDDDDDLTNIDGI